MLVQQKKKLKNKKLIFLFFKHKTNKGYGQTRCRSVMLYVCGGCQGTFGNKEPLIQHMAMMHGMGPDQMKYRCDEQGCCAKVFDTEQGLLDHHTFKHQCIQCPQCNASLGTVAYLQNKACKNQY